MKYNTYRLPQNPKHWIVIRKWGKDWEYFDSWDENEKSLAMMQAWEVPNGRVVTVEECERA